MSTPSIAAACHTPRQFWSRHREATLNWIALGVLLAAWNAIDGEPESRDPPAPGAQDPSARLCGATQPIRNWRSDVSRPDRGRWGSTRERIA